MSIAAIAVAGLWIVSATWSAAFGQTPPTSAELAGYGGLHAAAASGAADEIVRMAGSGADLDARDANGRTPLHVDAFEGRTEAARALILAGADTDLLDNQRYDAVTVAAVRNDLPMLRVLLGMGASAALVTSVYDGTALIAAAHLGHSEVVRELIAAGAPLDHVNNLGWTALMEAVLLGDGGARHTAVVRALVEAGASADIPDRSGRKPLDHARARGFVAMEEILREKTTP
jgi:ankyrin repeat protein